MAITVHTYKLLKYFSKDIANFGNILSLGRLDILIKENEFKKFNIPFSTNRYANNKFFFNFKFDSFSSLDVSKFEDADIIHDLNKPINQKFEKFDTIIDFGTSEHVFDIIQNLKNINSLCKKHGYIFHCLPANNNCGHGFWQFSPELFFQLYSEKNKFYNTEVILIDMLQKNRFYKVKNYTFSERLDFNSNVPLYLFVKTQKGSDDLFKPIYQSDYEMQWNNHSVQKHKKNKTSIIFKKIKNNLKNLIKNNNDLKFYKKKNFLRSKYIEKINI